MTVAPNPHDWPNDPDEVVDQSASMLVLARDKGYRNAPIRREFVALGSPGWGLTKTWSLARALAWGDRAAFERWRASLLCLAVVELAEGWELVEVALGEIGPSGDGRPVSEEALDAARREIEEIERDRDARRKRARSKAAPMMKGLGE